MQWGGGDIVKRKRLATTFSKMTTAFVCCGLIPLLLLSLFFFVRYNKIIRENLTTATSSMISYVSKSVGVVLDSVDEAMGVVYDYQDSDGNSITDILCRDDLSSSERELAIQTILRSVMTSSEYISSLRFVDTEGNLYSLYYSQDKTLRNDASEHTSMDVFSVDDDLTGLLVFGTIPEDEICVNSEDYIFGMIRNVMDVSTVESAHTEALGTLFADVNLQVLQEVVGKAGITQGELYILDAANVRYIYSEKEEDFLDGADPLAFCIEELEGESGCVQISGNWVFYSRVNEMGIYSVLVIGNDEFLGTLIQTRIYLALILCFACGALMVLYAVFSIRMSNPTRQLKEAMAQVQEGNMDVRVDLHTNDEMEYVADGFNDMVEKLQEYVNKVYVAQICQKDAELNALKMQIQPHFLYNTLDVIRMTALEQDDEKTAGLIEALAHQLRYVIGSTTERIYLKDELDAIREYFYIMRVRYDERISLNIYVRDEDLYLVIPKLLLQPIVENAIRHGLREKEGNGAVAIRVERFPDCLQIVVMDDGVGMTPELLAETNEALKLPTGSVLDGSSEVSIGMKNVYDRIQLTCGEEYGFRVQSACGMGTIVTYHLPVWEEL